MGGCKLRGRTVQAEPKPRTYPSPLMKRYTDICKVCVFGLMRGWHKCQPSAVRELAAQSTPHSPNDTNTGLLLVYRPPSTDPHPFLKQDLQNVCGCGCISLWPVYASFLVILWPKLNSTMHIHVNTLLSNSSSRDHQEVLLSLTL